MNRLYLLIIMFVGWGVCSGQNLVPNPSFEQQDSCPYNFNLLYLAQPWFNPTFATPDIFHSCATVPEVTIPVNALGEENARTGYGYAGIIAMLNTTVIFPAIVNWREYLEVKLDSTLQAGQKYFVSFYVSLADSVNYGTDDIGVYFSADTVKNYTSFNNLQLIPQVENPSGNFLINKLGWVKVSGSYIASGNERFITVGNFKDFNNTDTVIVPGGSNNSFNTQWYSGYYYVDDVCVSTDSLTCNSTVGINEVSNEDELILFPNPFSDKINITAKLTEQLEVSLYDVTSRKIFSQSFINSTTINTEQLAKGIYIYEVKNKSGVIRKGKVVRE